MSLERTVTVYGYRPRFEPDLASHSWRYKAPRELIVGALNAEVIEGTQEEVPASELDSRGRFCRLATGWGELPDDAA